MSTDHWQEAKEQRLRAHRAYAKQRELSRELEELRAGVAALADQWRERYGDHSVVGELRRLIDEGEATTD